MQVSLRGQFGGLGVALGIEEGKLKAIKVLKGVPGKPTPAAKSGLKRGDHVTAVNGWSTIGKPLSDAVQRIRGPVGTKVTLTVERDAWAHSRDITLTRDTIKFNYIHTQLLNDKLGYIALKGFSPTAAKDLEAALTALEGKAGGKLEGLVLDLRSNPGGYLKQVQEITDLFLAADNTIVTTTGSNGSSQTTRAKSGQRWERLPIVVLVNRYTASGAEIVAGSLKINDRAVLLGGITFGKGTVEKLFSNPDHSAVKISVGEYLIAGQLRHSEVGLLPDIELYSTNTPSEVLNRKNRPAGYSIATIRFIDLNLNPDDDDMSKDYPVKLAAELIHRGRSFRGSGMLRNARTYIKQQVTRQR